MPITKSKLGACFVKSCKIYEISQNVSKKCGGNPILFKQKDNQKDKQKDKQNPEDEYEDEYEDESNRKGKVIPPKISWIKNYCYERGNQVDPESFYNFYKSKGWMIGKNKMKDWQAAIRTWERDSKPSTTNTPKKYAETFKRKAI